MTTNTDGQAPRERIMKYYDHCGLMEPADISPARRKVIFARAQEARVDLREARERGDKSIEAFAEYAMAETLRLTHPKLALRHLARAEELTPDNPMFLLNIAFCHRALGAHEEALGIYNRLIDMLGDVPTTGHEYANALNERGITRGELNDLEGARSDFLLAFQMSANDPPTKAMLARNLAETLVLLWHAEQEAQHEVAKAVRANEAEGQQAPTTVVILHMTSKINPMVTEERLLTALGYAHVAVALDPTCREGHQILASVYDLLGMNCIAERIMSERNRASGQTVAFDPRRDVELGFTGREPSGT